MKTLIPIVCILLSASVVQGNTFRYKSQRSAFKIGAQIHAGIGTALGDNAVSWNENADVKPVLALSGGGYFAYWFNPLIGIELGYLLERKGTQEADRTDHKLIVNYVTFPVGPTIQLGHFRIFAGVAFSRALSGRIYENGTVTDMDDEKWENDFKQFNLDARMKLGWALHTPIMDIIPELVWSMHLLNDTPKDKYEEYPIFVGAQRQSAFMIGVSVER